MFLRNRLLNETSAARPLFAPDGAGSAAPTGTSPPASGAPSSGGTSAASPSTPSGAKPSPSVAPQEAPRSIPAGGGLVDDDIKEDPFDFEGILEGRETPDNEVALPATPEPPKAPAQQKPAEAAPALPPAQVAQAPQVVPVQPAAQQQGPQEQSPPLTPAEPGRIAQLLSQNEAFVTQQVAEQLFALSKEDVEALEADTVAHIPKLLARVYVRMQQAMLSQLQSSVPAMVHSYNKMRSTNETNEGIFFSKWPDLKPEVHGDVVRRIAVMYRKMNPQASLEQMVSDVGPLAMVAAGLNPMAQPQQQAAKPAVGVPATNGVRPPQPSPFVPAGAAGSVGTAPSSQANTDPWGFLGQTSEE